MDIRKLESLLQDSQVKFIVDPDNVPDGIQVVDVHFFKTAIDLERAQSHRDELAELLADWPAVSWGHPVQRLEEGPNFMMVGAVVDSQQRALLLFALGAVLGFWQVITPGSIGIIGGAAEEMAGKGMVMIDGYRPVSS